MRILFIGGTGNISAVCAQLLHRQGHRIIVVTRGRSPVPAEYTAVRADRYDRRSLAAAVGERPIDVVVNFLGFRPAEIEIDYQLFRHRVRQYVFISSTTVYGKPHCNLPLTEETPLGNQYSEYARNKQACEEWLLSRFRENGFPVTIVRPSHTYGKTWLPNTVSSASPIILRRFLEGRPVFLHNGGRNLWTVTAAEDFAVGLAGLLGRADTLGEVFHITSDEVLTWRQIYLEIARAAGVREPRIVPIPLDSILEADPAFEAGLRGDKAEHGVFDNEKIKRFVPAFDWRIKARQGLAESVAWFMADPARLEVKPELEARVDRILAAWERENGGL
ncbi:MAG: NAD-dependent epimerase/dehydratase family protein [Kiritimatiellaeota bacterium]|nr:NAD-dependent epimerase/dehydratase family protein [Kiritimatiellota bacterium]